MRDDLAASGNQRPVDPASEDEEELIHRVCETFVVGRRSSRGLHLPDGEGDKLCDTGASSKRLREVDSAVYPPGYQPICKWCLFKLRGYKAGSEIEFPMHIAGGEYRAQGKGKDVSNEPNGN